MNMLWKRFCSVSRWTWLRVASITGCLLSIAAAFVLAAANSDALRGYGTFWLAVSAVMSLYFVAGYSVLSVGWRQSEEGSIILALVGLLAALAGVGWVVRIWLVPPTNPAVPNTIVTIVFAWMMIWLAAVFTRRQIESRREQRCDQ